MLIGADGAWSKVRALLTDARPTYSGVSFVEADLHNGPEDHPAKAAAMGTGMLFAFQDNTGILGHLETNGMLHVYAGFRVPEDWVDTIDFTNTPAAKTAVLEQLPRVGRGTSRIDQQRGHRAHPAPHQHAPRRHQLGPRARRHPDR